MQTAEQIRVARVYELRGESPLPGSACRVLVDRLWPRGISREDVPLMCWVKAVAPSTELRNWYAHELDRWDEFAARYEEELASGEPFSAYEELLEHAADRGLVLVTASRDAFHSGAQVLGDMLARQIHS